MKEGATMKATKMYMVSVYADTHDTSKVKCSIDIFTSADNVKSVFGSALFANVFTSRKQAESVLQFWVDSYTKQGRYASIFE